MVILFVLLTVGLTATMLGNYIIFPICWLGMVAFAFYFIYDWDREWKKDIEQHYPTKVIEN